MAAMRRWLLLLIISLGLAPLQAAQPNRSDEYLAGYISAVLEKQVGWSVGYYSVSVENGFALITLAQELESETAKARDALGNVENVRQINFRVAEPTQQPPSTSLLRRFGQNVLRLSDRWIYFPTGDVFSPIIADPKQPQFFMSLRTYDATFGNVTVGAVGYGETFGLFRRSSRRSGDGLQISIAGALFAQFNMDAESHDLVNADYTIGLPVTYRKGKTSGRARLYHQSSHLGDEFLLNNLSQTRVNYSYEAMELLVARDIQPVRVFVGGEYFVNVDPSSFHRNMFHGGIDYRGPTRILNIGRLVGGVDWKSFEENDWSFSTSIVGGFEFGDPGAGRRHLRLLGEAYFGHAPNGQFYEDYIEYWGAGVYLGF